MIFDLNLPSRSRIWELSIFDLDLSLEDEDARNLIGDVEFMEKQEDERKRVDLPSPSPELYCLRSEFFMIPRNIFAVCLGVEKGEIHRERW